jgi:putative ABC transport system permease protein
MIRTFVAQLAREVQYAAHVLRRSSGVTMLSVWTMGMGIGLTAVLFTLINGILLRPLPYPEPDRLVRIFDTNPSAGIDRAGAASGNLDDWRRRAGAFDGLAGYYSMGRTATFGEDSNVVITAQVSRDFFELMHVAPVAGRPFTQEETERAVFNSAAMPIGVDPVVILSHSIWQQRFGGDPNVIGQVIHLERRPFKVVGVMPSGFAMPDAGVQLWIPWSIAATAPRDQHYLGAVARLKARISVAQAEDRVNAVARELGTEYPATNRGWGVRISPLETETVGAAAAILWLLLAAVALVLLIACANVALLSLMRGLDRREETWIRLALGASSGRLLREFLVESVLLAAFGGLMGTAIAVGGIRLLPALKTDLPRLNEVAFDFQALTFIVLMTVLAGILSGLPQAWRRSRTSSLNGLSSSRVTEGADRHRLRDGIVVTQVALAVVLMTASGLLVRSFLQLRDVDPGFDPRGVLVAPVFLDSQAYNTGDKARGYYRTLFERLSALPGVLAVGGATTVPTSPLGPDFERPVWPAGSTTDESQRVQAAVRMATPGYFKAMGLRVTAGRPFDDRDSPDAPRVLMVSETLAKRMWPDQSAVGRQLVVDYSTSGTYPYEIVGVVSDLRFRGPRSQPLAEIYIPHAQRPYLILNVVLKTAGNPRALISSVRAVMKSVDPQKPAQSLTPLEDLLGATYARDGQAMVLLLVFASASICLAVVSVYGALSQRVRERSREIGIRMAIGADASDVAGWVAASGLRLIALGLASGALIARTMSGALDGLLFGVASTDVKTTLVVMVALGGVGLTATLVPAVRAARIDPVQVLKRG